MAKKYESLTLLIVILHDLEVFPDLLGAWKKIGVPGVTILQSVGGFHAQDVFSRSGLSNLFALFDQGKTNQRTLWALIDDPDLLEKAISEADRVVRGFDRPHSGILFTLPAGTALGLQKWGAKKQRPETEVEETPETSPLLRWFEEDIKARGEGRMLENWRQKRSTPVARIMEQLELRPIVVRTDSSLPQVVQNMLSNPRLELACVVNSEERLMGVIAQHQLGEAMLVNIVPEEFIENPEDYSKAMQAASGNTPRIAADIMQPPVFVSLADTLDTAYQRMHRARLVGLPVVDEHYHVLGYISLLELLTVCYPDAAGQGQVQ